MSYHRGITLIELVVVSGVAALLVGLLAPTLLQSRAAAARAQCASNLRQLGLALHHFHGIHRVFPASGWTRAGPGNPAGKYVGWRSLCLPFLEETPTYSRYDFRRHWWEAPNLAVAMERVPVFECPSTANRVSVLEFLPKPPRPALILSEPFAASDYEAIRGVQPSVDMRRYSNAVANRSVMFRNSSVRATDVLDGTSRTIAVLECVARPSVYLLKALQAGRLNDQGQGWADSESAFSIDGASPDGTLQGLEPVLTPVAINATNDNEPYAFHPSGINVLFADSHVSPIDMNIDLLVFAEMCTRSAGEISTRN